MALQLIPDTSRRPLTVITGRDVDPFLRDMVGIHSDVIRIATQVGMAEAGMVTAHSSKSAFGWRFWDGALASWRDELKSAGWTTERPYQLEVVRRPDQLLQITPSMGDAGTGLASATPTCKNERGGSTRAAISDNQISLGDLAPIEPGWKPIQTWWHLYNVVTIAGDRFVRSELSLPTVVRNDKLTEWAYRVVLDERPFNPSRQMSPIPAPTPVPAFSLVRK